VCVADTNAEEALAGWGNGDASSTVSNREKTPRTGFAGLGLLSGFFHSNPRARTPFKPQKSNRGTSSWQLKQYAEATLGSGSLRKAVKLPEGEDKDEWLAVNGELVVDTNALG
jgi:MOB kinase activator 1